ncbi:hypothetical protein MTR67_040712 [Solanum verrucosum]|uniref:Uncharacterized protein n=1 Tax=Solanum verrucosum TaxID=315347 RepID=A0AAF0ZPN2_SOLVR|nr:hypothetical protein MTR67_040712 [Solanum verrucosum]
MIAKIDVAIVEIGKLKKDRYNRPNDRPKPKGQARPEGNRTKEMLTRIFNKVEQFDKVLKDLKNDFYTLTQMVASHSMSIEKLETQMFQISTHLNPRQ